MELHMMKYRSIEEIEDGETWYGMIDRQKQERIDTINWYNQKENTQTEVTYILGITKTHLNNFIKRNNIVWKRKYISR